MLGRLRGRAWWLLAVTSLVGCGGDSGGNENGSGTGGSSGVETGGRGGSTTSGGAGTGGANNDAGESGTATGGRNAAGGSTTGGRISSGGTPSGGKNQAGGAGPTGGKGEAAGSGSGGVSGAPSSAEHCSPGKTYENFRAYDDAGGPISNCYGYDPTDVGQPADAEISVRSIALADPLAAGSEMAFSIEWIAGGASIEYWGTNESCGAGVERLSSATSLAPNITCSTWEGAAEVNHVLMVWVQGGGQHGDVTLCEAGSC